MTVGLRDRIAMPATFARVGLIGVNDVGICPGVTGLEPTQQGWPKVETDVRVVINDSFAASLRIVDARATIGLVTFGVNALVPVVKRRSAGFDLDDARPRILARWLVEMAVDDKSSHWTGFTRLSG